MSRETAGRPTKYNPTKNEWVEKFCRLGCTDKELAESLEISEATLNTWKHKHAEFLESIKRGKDVADANVSDRLYQRAMGFEHDSEEIKVVSNSGTNAGSSIERVPIKKIYPPDTTAAIFWLKNRRPRHWRDKQELTVNPGEEVKKYVIVPASEWIKEKKDTQ